MVSRFEKTVWKTKRVIIYSYTYVLYIVQMCDGEKEDQIDPINKPVYKEGIFDN